MAEMSDEDRLTHAANLWTGRGKEMFPHRDDSAVIAVYGIVEGARLLEKLRALKGDFYASDARHRAGTLVEMGEMASRDFKQAHPEVSDEIVEAFAWCYTFDYK